MAEIRSDYDLEIPLANLVMNTAAAPDSLPDGAAVRIEGIDGRYTGSAMKYPGHKYVADLTGNSDLTNVSFFRHITMIVNDVERRGFVVSYQKSGTTVLELHYYNQSSWAVETIDEELSYTSADQLDVAVYDKFLYTFCDGDEDYPKVSYYDSGWKHTSLGAYTDGGELAYTGQVVAPVHDEDGDDTGGYLNFRGVYRTAVKFYDPTRKVFTGLSDILTADMTDHADTPASGDTYVYGITVDGYLGDEDEDDLPEGFTDIYVYRTVNLKNPLDVYNGGRFYLERIVTRSESQAATDTTIGILHDLALVQQEPYDPWSDTVTAPPDSGAVCEFDDILIAARDTDDNGGIGLVWTNPASANHEDFGTYQKYSGDPSDGSVKKIISTSGAAYAFSDNSIYRIVKSGANVAVGRLRRGISLASKEAACAVGENILMLTHAGLAMLDAEGNINYLDVFDRVFLDEWIDDLDNITMAYDSFMDCVYVLRPAGSSTGSAYVGQLLCVWLRTQRISLLDGVPFRAVTGGSDVVWDKEGERAYFIAQDLRIVTPNCDRTYASGQDTTYIGTMTGRTAADKNTVGESGIDLTGKAGRCVYMLTGDNAGTFFYSAGGSISAETAGGATAVYALDPIALRVRLAPIREATMRPFFGRKVLRFMAAKLSQYSIRANSSNRNTRMKFGVYRHTAGLASDTLSSTATLDAGSLNPAEMVAEINDDGITLEPYFEHVSGGTDIELTALNIMGIVTTSKNVET